MKSLHALLVHRDNDRYRTLAGWWSYAVPEFTWETRKVPANDFILDLDGAETRYDLVVLDDWIFGTIQNKHLPLVYVTVDSMRSPAQLQRNLYQARYADLILSDSDQLANLITPDSKPVRRFAHCVDERLFFPRSKIYDVAFLCWPTPARREVQNYLHSYCEVRGYSFVTGTYPPEEYAKRLCSAKIVVHKPHVEQGRSWRVFDTMAGQGCLVSPPLPHVTGDYILPYEHYIPYEELNQLGSILDAQLEKDEWRHTARCGYDLVMAEHTWSLRARQLRAMLNEMLGL